MTPEQEKEALRYDLESLRKHIQKRRDNIKIFEQAISEERDAIDREERMITFLESRKNTTSK